MIQVKATWAVGALLLALALVLFLGSAEHLTDLARALEQAP